MKKFCFYRRLDIDSRLAVSVRGRAAQTIQSDYVMRSERACVGRTGKNAGKSLRALLLNKLTTNNEGKSLISTSDRLTHTDDEKDHRMCDKFTCYDLYNTSEREQKNSFRRETPEKDEMTEERETKTPDAISVCVCESVRECESVCECESLSKSHLLESVSRYARRNTWHGTIAGNVTLPTTLSLFETAQALGIIKSMKYTRPFWKNAFIHCLRLIRNENKD